MKTKIYFILYLIILFTITSCEKYETCNNCNGRGEITQSETCTNCKGKGELRCNYSKTQSYTWFGGGGSDKIRCYHGKLEGYRSMYDYKNGEICPSCNGSGWVKCYSCDGYGYKNESTTCYACNGNGSKLTSYGEFINSVEVREIYKYSWWILFGGIVLIFIFSLFDNGFGDFLAVATGIITMILMIIVIMVWW